MMDDDDDDGGSDDEQDEPGDTHVDDQNDNSSATVSLLIAPWGLVIAESKVHSETCVVKAHNWILCK